MALPLFPRIVEGRGGGASLSPPSPRVCVSQATHTHTHPMAGLASLIFLPYLFTLSSFQDHTYSTPALIKPPLV